MFQVVWTIEHGDNVYLVLRPNPQRLRQKRRVCIKSRLEKCSRQGRTRERHIFTRARSSTYFEFRCEEENRGVSSGKAEPESFHLDRALFRNACRYSNLDEAL